MTGFLQLSPHPLVFRTSFRSAKGRDIYDPSLGRRAGRIVSRTQMSEAVRGYERLYLELSRHLVAKTALSIVLSVVIAVALIPRLQLPWPIAFALALLFVGVYAPVMMANRRLRRFRRAFAASVAHNPAVPPLTDDERKALGYKTDWKTAAKATAFVLFAVAGHSLEGLEHLGYLDFLRVTDPRIVFWLHAAWLAVCIMLFGLLVRSALKALKGARTGDPGGRM